MGHTPPFIPFCCPVDAAIYLLKALFLASIGLVVYGGLRKQTCRLPSPPLVKNWLYTTSSRLTAVLHSARWLRRFVGGRHLLRFAVLPRAFAVISHAYYSAFANIAPSLAQAFLFSRLSVFVPCARLFCRARTYYRLLNCHLLLWCA